MVRILYAILLIVLILSALSLLVREVLIWRDRYKIRQHLRAVDERVKRQAIAAGVWNKEPIVLGGRALELKANERFNMEREPGETDAELRRRYNERVEEADDGIW